jgi:hypothetical protein
MSTDEKNSEAATAETAGSPANENNGKTAQANLPAVIPPAIDGETEVRPGWLARLFGLRRRAGSNVRENLEDVLAGDRPGHHTFSAEERRMLNNILRLKDVRVQDLMIPRSDIESVETNIPLGDLLKLFEKSGHSRMPVYAETLDDPFTSATWWPTSRDRLSRPGRRRGRRRGRAESSCAAWRSTSRSVR